MVVKLVPFCCSKLQYTLRLCKDYPELEPPSALLKKILLQTTGQYEFLSWRDYLRELFRPLYASPRFAAGTLLAAISMSIVFNAMGVNFSNLSLSDLTPRNLMERVDRVINIAYDNGLRRLNDLKILYQIQSRLEELNIQGEEEKRVPQEKDKKKEGSGLSENSSVQSMIPTVRQRDASIRIGPDARTVRAAMDDGVCHGLGPCLKDDRIPNQ